MPYHEWGDESFDWSALNNAITYIDKTCTRYGRIGIHSKEKFGTHRCSGYLFDGTLHSLLYPGYVCNRMSKWMRNVDSNVIRRISRYTGLIAVVNYYQSLVYNYAFQQACKKWPHITDEIVSGVDGYPMIKSGIFGKVDGTAIRNKYWTTLL